jgi:hypothetical protein
VAAVPALVADLTDLAEAWTRDRIDINEEVHVHGTGQAGERLPVGRVITALNAAYEHRDTLIPSLFASLRVASRGARGR